MARACCGLCVVLPHSVRLACHARHATPAAATHLFIAVLPPRLPSRRQVFTLGASVTRGIGTTDRRYSYASRLFEWIQAAFPHK